MSAEPTRSEAENGGEKYGDPVRKDIADSWGGLQKQHLCHSTQAMLAPAYSSVESLYVW